MVILGLEFIAEQLEREHFQAKAVFNANGIIFFPVQKEHRDQKAAGISYEDNYKGNALAAMVMRGRLEIRFHEKYSDVDVAKIVNAFVQRFELNFLASWNVTYQGRPLAIDG